MRVYSIVGEYNPFHMGHEHLIHMTRKNGCSHLITVMSGNYVQRGDVALVSKFARTRSALNAGVDLVLELPTLFSLSRAETFAMGAMQIIDALNVVDVLSFGSESGDIGALSDAAACILTQEFSRGVKDYLSLGMTFARARERAISDLCNNDVQKVVSNPNDILAIEYIKSLMMLGSRISLQAVKRIGAQHDEQCPVGNIVSASFIRRKIKDVGLNEEIACFVPKGSLDVLKQEFENNNAPADVLNGERAIIARLRSLTKTELRDVFDVSEGLENRIYQAIKKTCSLDELYDYVKTKRYTHARIRRIVFSAFLGITKRYEGVSPEYIRVLGFNKRGLEILRAAKGKSKLPIVVRSSDVLKLGDKAKEMFALQTKFDDLYSIFTPCLKAIETSPVIYVD